MTSLRHDDTSLHRQDPSLDREVEPATSAAARSRPWRRALIAGLIVWIASKVGLFAATLYSWIGEPRPGVGFRSAAVTWATRFDSAWFIDIADNGYPDTLDDAHSAFFPLYPGLIRLCTPLFLGEDWLAALFVANVALFAALVLLYRLTENEFGRAPASRTIFYLVAFPTGFFLTAAYNEGLFIALLVAVLYSMRRGNFWLAGALGAVAGATRSAGILLVLPFAYEYLRQRGRRPRWDMLALGLMPLGLVSVMIVNKLQVNDPLAFSHAQSAHWGRELTWPWIPYYDSAKIIVSGGDWRAPFGELWVHNLLEFGTVTLGLAMMGLALVGPWRVRRDQLVFPLFGLALLCFITMFPSTFTDRIAYPLLSTSRIGLEVFPMFMMLGLLGARFAAVDRIVLAICLPVQGILVAQFLHSGWIA